MIDIKFCGLQSDQDVRNAVKTGADTLGFVFARSKRKVAPEAVQHWLASVSLNEHQKTAAVMVDPSHEDIHNLLESVSLDILQFHGNESPQFLLEVKKATGKQIIKALRHRKGTLDQLSAFSPFVDGFIVDAGSEEQKGGTGRRFNWGTVPVYIHFARQLNRPLWIAGGISPENVDELLAYNPDGIDVSSGIENEGCKDQTKMEAIVKQVSKDEYVLS
ncbi:phosphoribosylanthranilate isomerase [Geomicrobium halophilum]|uniref:N-(5'-phosphoribosyl)anthranilate isomerase n=1 Tax=Geomicrobium halophilum TaxID=549000 RepID=A0A841PX91_9BACL|nr:phosphoribosylanthranilate isomerase [Geomicrobium halophilum]MBB6449043.1 phosphoribosylanthranilate isomerase [Geomicrobium halophilum]